MTAEVLDTITDLFVASAQSGFGMLMVFMLGLFSVLAMIHYSLSLGRVMMTGGAPLGEALAAFFLLCLTLGFYVFMVTYWEELLTAAMQTFLTWGLEPTGGTFTIGAFQTPSTIVDEGFAIAKPINDMLDRTSGWAMVFNLHKGLGFLLAWLAIVLSFFAIALAAMLSLIEFHIALCVSPVLVPWIALSYTSVFGELGLSWLAAGLVRLLATALMISLGVNLFGYIDVELGNAATLSDTTFYQAIVAACCGVVFAGLTWIVSNKAAALGGRGMALALSSAEVYGSIWRYGASVGGAVGGAIGHAAGAAAGGAVRGTSQLVQSLRGAP
jgi:type IV secretion system protein TrbL